MKIFPDDIRIIPSINTQVRCIPILIELLLNIGDRLVYLETLKTYMISWGEDMEATSPFYMSHKGKIGNRESKAFEYYVNFLVSINFVIKDGDFVKCSQYGTLFLLIFDRNKKNLDIELTNNESLFWFFWLLIRDSDIILTLIEFLYHKKIPISDSEIRKSFDIYFNERLTYKNRNVGVNSILGVNDKMGDQFRLLFKKSKENNDYAYKHFIPPRLEWLCDLDLLIKGKDKKYCLTEKGCKLYELLPSLETLLVKDINQNWIDNYIFMALIKVFENKKERNNFNTLSLSEQKEKIGYYLELVSKKFIDYRSSRIPSYPSLLFVTFSLIFEPNNYFINISNLESIFSEDFIYNNKQYILRKSPRINESYITIKNV